MDGLGQNMALSVLYIFFPIVVKMLCKIRWEGPHMNSTQYQERINKLLDKLKEDMPKAERLLIIEEIKGLLSAFFVA